MNAAEMTMSDIWLTEFDSYSCQHGLSPRRMSRQMDGDNHGQVEIVRGRFLQRKEAVYSPINPPCDSDSVTKLVYFGVSESRRKERISFW